MPIDLSSFKHARRAAALALFFAPLLVHAQCTWYTITVNDSPTAWEVSWSLIDQNGVVWTSGSAPWDEDICLPDGCYTLMMFDSGGDGWEDEDWFIADWTGDFDWDTNLPNGPHGTDGFVLGADMPCDPNAPGCPAGTSPFQLIISSGTQPGQIDWDVTLNGTVLYAGGAPFNDTLCLDTACYWMHLYDAAGNGWNGATYTLKYFGGATLYTGTLAAGDLDSVQLVIGGADCTAQPPGGGGGPCTTAGDPTGDCPTVVCVCDPFIFPITPSGFGSIDEIPPPGSISNPSFGGGVPPPPWGGTDFGCLLAAELNSSWMLVNIGTTGSLGFSFGGGGQQMGYYDWSMWLYNGPSTCSAIAGNTLPPVRCLWNAVPWGGTGMANTLPPGADPGNYAPELPVTAGEQYIICMSNWSYMTMDVTLDFFGTATVQCGLVLPIELLDFSAVPAGGQVRLAWTTATEINSHHFVIERSLDGVAFEVLGTVAAAGESQGLLQYDLVDPAPYAGTSYYRLTEYDADGSLGADEVRAVHRAAEGQDLAVMPDAATDVLWLGIPAGGAGTVSLLDMTGRAVFHTTYPGDPQRSIVGIPTAAVPTGAYLIVVASADRRLTARTIVQR